MGKKISELTATTNPHNDALIPLAYAGENYKVRVADLRVDLGAATAENTTVDTAPFTGNLAGVDSNQQAVNERVDGFSLAREAVHLFDFVPAAEQAKMLSRTVSLNDQMEYLQDAIDAVETAGTEKFKLVAPPVLISAYTDALMSASGFVFEGGGSGTFHEKNSGENRYENQSKRLLIQWEGPVVTSSPMLLVESPVPVDLSQFRLQGGIHISGVSFRGLNQAGTTLKSVGLEVRNVAQSTFERMFFGAFSEAAFEGGRHYDIGSAVAGPDGYPEAMFSSSNVISQMYFDQSHASAGHCIWVSDRGGDNPSGGWWFSKFANLWMLHNNGDGIRLELSDTLHFSSVQMSRSNTGTGAAISLMGHNRVSDLDGTNNRVIAYGDYNPATMLLSEYTTGGHIFDGCSTGSFDYQGRIITHGTETYLNPVYAGNQIINHDRLNSNRWPITGTDVPKWKVSDITGSERGKGVSSHVPIEHDSVVGDHTLPFGTEYIPNDYSLADTPEQLLGQFMTSASNIHIANITGECNLIVQTDGYAFTGRLHLVNPDCHSVSIRCTTHPTVANDVKDCGEGVTINVNATNKTLSRTAGDFTTDGFHAGQVIQLTGFPTSNTTKVISTVSALVITCTNSTGLTTESGGGDERIVGLPTHDITLADLTNINATKIILDINFADGVLTGSVNWSSKVYTSTTGTIYGGQNSIEYTPGGASSATVFAFQNILRKTGDQNCSGGLSASYNQLSLLGGGTYASFDTAASYSVPLVNHASANVTGAVAGQIVRPVNLVAGTVDEAMGLWVKPSTVTSGTLTTQYGILIGALTQGTNNYPIYSAGGDSYHAGNFAISGCFLGDTYAEIGLATLSYSLGRLECDYPLSSPGSTRIRSLSGTGYLDIINGQGGVTAQAITIEGSGSATWNAQALAALSSTTSSAAELNILDGATISTAELNRVGGLTSSAQVQLDNMLESPASTVTDDTIVAFDGAAGVLAKACVTTKAVLDGFFARTWHNETANRTFTAGDAASSTYQNINGYPIQLSINMVGTATTGRVKLVTGATSSPTVETAFGSWYDYVTPKKESTLIVDIPSGWYYKLTLNGGNTLSSITWFELY